MLNNKKRNLIQRRITRRVRPSNYLSTSRETTGDVRTTAIVLLVAVVAVLLLVPPASAQSAACNEILENQSNASQSSAPSGPGGQLADVIGDKHEEIGRAFDDAQFDARLANATSNRMKAEIIAERVNRTDERLSTLERCWQSHLAAQETGNSTAELDATQVDSLEQQVRSLHQRVNETKEVAARLPDSLREEYGIDAERFDTLEERVGTLRHAVGQPEVEIRRPVPERR